MLRAYRNDKQVFTVGNGGSSSTASHMAADLAKNTIGTNMKRFRITSLSDNASIVTALANDVGYDSVFSEQLVNMIAAGDVLVVISASGNSPNVLKAIHCARLQSAEVVGLLGCDGGAALALVDIPIVVRSSGLRNHRGRPPGDQPHAGRVLQPASGGIAPLGRLSADRRISTAMLLGAGRGTRLAELGLAVPKVLVPVGGRPLLARQIDYLAEHGVERVVVNAHHLAEAIEAFAAEYAGPVELTVVTEPRLLGTAGSVRNALEILGQRALSSCSTAMWSSTSRSPRCSPITSSAARPRRWRSTRARSSKAKARWTVDEDGCITRFLEKDPDVRPPALINAGLYVLEPDLLADLPKGEELDFGYDVFPGALSARRKDPRPSASAIRCSTSAPRRA